MPKKLGEYFSGQLLLHYRLQQHRVDHDVGIQSKGIALGEGKVQVRVKPCIPANPR